MINRQWQLAKRPFGEPTQETWHFAEQDVAELQQGQVLIKVLYISLDPAMRGWLNDSKSYIEPVQIGQVMRAGTVGIIEASKNPKFAVGDHVVG